MKIEFSFDDGHLLDLQLANLLEDYGFTATFYLPTHSRLSEDKIRALARHHEIGGHTVTHQILTSCSLERAKWEIEENKKLLERVINKNITKFCYPRGRYNQDIKKLVKEAGYEYARTTRVRFDTPQQDPFETHTSLHIYNRSEYEGQDWFSFGLEYLNILRQRNDPSTVFHIWGHSWEIEKFGQWQRFEHFLQEIRSVQQ